MPNGFDDIFAELTNINAEQVLLGERVRLLEEQMSEGALGGENGDGAADRPAGEPVRWHELDAEQHAVLWPQFVSWVIWAADRYEMTTDQIPRQCWWQHGAVVEELTALWTSHESAYAGGEDGGSAPYLWQDALARALERISRNWLGSCRNGQHKARHRDSVWGGDAEYLTLLLAAGENESDGDAPGASPGETSHDDEDGSE